MTETIYYLPGYGGQLQTGLGQGLLDRGFNVTGRQTTGDFRGLPFSEQVGVVADDLKTHFWQDTACVVANSFGAYLFLHAQAQLPAFPGRVLLLSPIVGGFTDDEKGMNFLPPLPERLQELIRDGLLPAPRVCEIHVGSQDWQSNPQNVTCMADALGISVSVVPGAGHMLGKDYVGMILDKWLPKRC